MWLFRWLGIIMGAASLVMLLKQGFVIGSFVTPLQLMLDYYDALMRFLFGWVEPYLSSGLAYVVDWTGWSLRLDPHWKHILVLLWLYIGATVRNAWSGTWSGAKTTAVYRAVLGVIVALAASVAAGTVPLGDATSNMLMAVFPVAGIVIYRLGFAARFATERWYEGRSWWTEFRAKAIMPGARYRQYHHTSNRHSGA